MNFSITQVTSDWAETAGLPCVRTSTIASTNAQAKDNAIAESAALSLYITDHQTQGRGRGTHTWSDSGVGHALLSSWSFLMLAPPQPVLSPAIGLALFKAANTTWFGFPWSLKAPNDLYLGDKKVAGLLLENVQEGKRGRLITGLGMNVTGHPAVDRSGALTDMIPASELTPEIWRQFLDRLLLELTSTLLLTEDHLVDSQRRALLLALNLYPETQNGYTQVLPDGGLVKKDGSRVNWSDL